MGNNIILVVVNDVFFYTKLRDALKRHGYQLEKARTQTEVADKARALHPAAIILNLNDEKLDAFVALDALKSDDQLRAIPILAFVNHDDVDHWKRAQQLGVTKVVSRNEFSASALELVRAVMATQGTSTT